MIVITGAAGGLGRAVTARISRDHEVLALARTQLQLETMEVHGAVCDVTSESSVIDAFSGLSNVSAVVHLVGGYTGGTPIWNTDLADLERMYSLNLRSAFLVIRQAARTLRARTNPGSIVCVGSVSGRTGAKGHGPYAATKAAVHSLVRSAAADLKSEGIRVNAVLPGMIATPANLAAMPNADHSQWVTPEQIADTIAWLISDASSGVTGTCIEVASRGYTP